VITPGGTTACAANFNLHTVTPITVATGRAGTPIKVGKQPTAVELVP